MEEQWIIDRARLRDLLAEHPDWTKRRLAEEMGRSISWVKKWRRRFREAEPNDDSVLYGLSRARHNPPPSIAEEVVERILEIRDHPPENLGRTPGPKAILYYLHKDEALKASGGLPATLDQHHLGHSGPSRPHLAPTIGGAYACRVSRTDEQLAA